MLHILFVLIALGAASAAHLPGLGSDTVYAGGYEADALFESIPDSCLEKIRNAGYLFGSRSYGRNMLDGITRYGADDAKYAVTREQYDVRRNGTDAVPDNAFSMSRIVHELCTIDGYERVPEFAELVGRFYDEMDVGMLEAWPSWPNTTDPVGSLDLYGRVLDSLGAAHPAIRFVYHTRHMSSDPAAFDAEKSMNSAVYRDSLFARYMGKVPVYDFFDVMSTRAESPSTGAPCTRVRDGVYNHADCVCDTVVNGDTLRMCCPEYDNGINGHPSMEIAERRFGRSLYVLWSRMLCGPCTVNGDTTAAAGAGSTPGTGVLLHVDAGPVRTGHYVRIRCGDAGENPGVVRSADGRNVAVMRAGGKAGAYVFRPLLPGVFIVTAGGIACKVLAVE